MKIVNAHISTTGRDSRTTSSFVASKLNSIPNNKVLPKDDAFLLRPNKDYTLSELEKHIRDYKSGKAQLSSKISKSLSGQDFENSTSLLAGTSKAASYYRELLTAGLPYDDQARLINSVNKTMKSLSAIG